MIEGITVSIKIVSTSTRSISKPIHFVPEYIRWCIITANGIAIQVHGSKELFLSLVETYHQIRKPDRLVTVTLGRQKADIHGTVSLQNNF